MTTYIKKSKEELSEVAGTAFATSFFGTENPAKPSWCSTYLKSFVLASILLLGLVLSVISDYLFFREMLLSTGIIGMTMFLKAVQHPTIIVSRDDRNRAHLN